MSNEVTSGNVRLVANVDSGKEIPNVLLHRVALSETIIAIVVFGCQNALEYLSYAPERILVSYAIVLTLVSAGLLKLQASYSSRCYAITALITNALTGLFPLIAIGYCVSMLIYFMRICDNRSHYCEEEEENKSAGENAAVLILKVFIIFGLVFIVIINWVTSSLFLWTICCTQSTAFPSDTNAGVSKVEEGIANDANFTLEDADDEDEQDK